MKYIHPQETLVYRVRKSIAPVFMLAVFIPIWLYFGFLFLTPCLKALFSGSPDIYDKEYYVSGMIGLVVFLPLVVILILSYWRNRLVITDQRIYIRKGMSGKRHILNLADIRSFQHAYSTGRHNSNHAIHFYLHCGKVIKTGNLYATLSSLQALLEVLRQRFEGRGFTKQELKEMARNDTQGCQSVTKTNVLILALPLLPVLLALIYSFVYLLHP